ALGESRSNMRCHQTRSFFLLFVVLFLRLKVTDPNAGVKLRRVQSRMRSSSVCICSEPSVSRKLMPSLLGMSFLETLGSLQMQTDELRIRD
ncbi:hypothetical protein, partial [Rhizobium hidalgonense]|uniref:hypothetical protein n=1 Tax=Rhizobium hidalgonense TaxID=1538159 RepID=UPI001FDF4526